MTLELFSAFTKSLQDYRIDISFIAGAWQDMNIWTKQTANVYDLILSSETIYRISGLTSLISLLQTASMKHPEQQEEDLSDKFPPERSGSLCFIAAKVIYFGVGGGVDTFAEAVAQSGGHCHTVFEKASGVSRRILQVTWNHKGSESS